MERVVGRPIYWTRREVVLGALRSAGFIGMVGSGAGFLLLYADRDANLAHSWGANIPGEEPRILITDKFGEYEVAIKKKPSLSERDIIGFTKPGIEVMAQPVLGPTYGGLPVVVNGQNYGRWYRVTVPAYRMAESQILVAEVNPETGVQKKITGVASENYFIRPKDQPRADSK